MVEAPMIGPGLTFVHSACGGLASVRHEEVGRRGPLGLFKKRALVVECAKCGARCGDPSGGGTGKARSTSHGSMKQEAARHEFHPRRVK